jgi:hypothetical protein
MPRVARPAGAGVTQLGAVKPIAADTPYQNLKAPDLSSGARLMQEMGAKGQDAVLAQSASQLADRQQDETLKLLEAQEQGAAEERSIIDEMSSTQEGNAIGSAKKAKDRINAFIDSMATTEGLTTQGKIARKRYENSLRNSVSSQGDQHERAEKQKYITNMAKTSITTAQERGVDYYHSDTEMTKQAGLIAQRSKSVAELTTVPGTKGAKILAERLRSENVSKMYTGAIDRALANGHTERAKDLLAQAKAGGLIDAASGDLGRAEKAVSIGTNNQFAKDNAPGIVSDNAGNLAAALKAARNMAGGNAEKEDALVEEVKTQFGEIEAAEKISLKKKKADAVGLARAGKFDEIPNGDLAEMGGPMTSTLEAISARKRRGAAIQSVPSVYNKFNNMSADALAENIMTPEALSQLSDDDWQKFSDRQANNTAEKTAQQSRTQIVTGALKSAGITSDESIYNFNKALDLAIRSIEEDKGGKKATPEEVRKATDLLLIEGEYKGTTVDPDVRAYELKEGQTFLLDDYSDIPDTEIAAIRKEAGDRRLSNAQVLQVYNAKINADIKKAKGWD